LTENNELSYGARGMMAYLLSKPDNWQVRMADLENGPDGKARTRTLFKELEAAGYLTRERRHTKDGKWLWTTTIYEEPQAIDTETNEAEAIARKPIDGKTDDILNTHLPSTHLDTVVSGAPLAQPDSHEKTVKKRATSADQRMKTAKRRAVIGHFENKTNLRCPQRGNGKQNKGVARLWWNPMREICELAEWDVARAQKIVDDALSKLDGMTVSDPNSILKTARAVAAKGVHVPVLNKEGFVIMPSGGKR